MLRSELQLRHRRQSRHPWLMMPPIAACMAIFRPLPSSFMLWARRNASSPKTAASSCCSSIFFLSKILPSSLSAFSLSRLRAEMSCVGFFLMSMVFYLSIGHRPLKRHLNIVVCPISEHSVSTLSITKFAVVLSI